MDREEIFQVKIWYWVWMRQYSHWENRETHYWRRFELNDYLERMAQFEEGKTMHYKKGDKEWKIEVTSGYWLPREEEKNDQVQETERS